MSSMRSIIQEAPAGQLIRYITGNKYFKYPEEEPGFQLPWENAAGDEKGLDLTSSSGNDTTNTSTPAETLVPDTRRSSQDNAATTEKADLDPLSKAKTDPLGLESGLRASKTMSRTMTRERTLPWSAERFDIEEQEKIDRMESTVIMPTTTADGITLVDWYTTDDAANPYNWQSGKKAWTAFVIFWYTFVVYCASAIYTSSEQGVMKAFGVGQSKASLGLSMYVIGYGLGPMLFSPLSELPVIGRNIPYIISITLFTILAVPTALVDNYAGLLVLRTLTGFMGSPCLATGGASMGDMYCLVKLPYALIAWTAGSFCAPVVGPIIAGFAVMAKGWRWSLWEILWMAGPTFIIMFLLMPETSSGNILLRRAKRLRKLTGNPNLKSQSEIDQGTKSFKAIAFEQLVKPIEISVRDPAVLFTHVYTSCIYGIYYSFFEVWPLVYGDIYHFNLGELGLPFISIIVGCAVGSAIFASYQWFYLEPDIIKNGLRAQEHRLVPANYAVVLLPAGLFWFGWTAQPHIHWIVCTIGLTLFPIGAYILFQCIFIYLPLTYPQFAASLFAANDLCRSMLASGAIIYAHPLYVNLGIARGVTLLAGLLCGGCMGLWALYYFGAKLRAKSKFAMK